MGKKRRKKKQKEGEASAAKSSSPAAFNLDLPKGPARAVACWLSLAWVLICPFHSVFHGIDLTDMGLAATANQQVFRDPDSVSLTFWGGWFSLIFGGLWDLIFGGLGYISIKLGQVALMWGSAGVLYVTLRRWFRRDLLLMAIALGTWYICARNMVQWLAYDMLSMFWVTFGGCLLLRGLKRRSNTLFFWAGFVLSMNVFVRLPSLLALWLGTVIPFYWWLKHRNMKASLPACCWCWGGMAAGAASVCLLFIIMRQPLVDLAFFQLATSEGHGIGAMLGRHAKEYGFVAKESGTALLIVLAAGVGIAWIRNAWAVLAAAIGLGILAYQWGMPQSRWTLWVNGTLLVGCIAQLIILKRRSPMRSALLWLAVWQLFLTPLGSNTGLVKSCMGMWFAFPALFLGIWNWRAPRSWSPVPGSSFRVALVLFFGALFIGSFRLAYYNVYRDTPDRSQLTATVDHPKLRGLKTTPRRARVLTELMNNVTNPDSPAYIKPGEYVLGIGSIAGFHYLTETRPYYYTPWIELLSKEGKLEAGKRALERDKTPPVLVVCRHTCRNAIWPPPPQMNVPLQKPIPNLRLYDPNAGFDDPRSWELKWAGEFFHVYRAKEGVTVSMPTPPEPPPPPSDLDLPERGICAHRGAMRTYPENSLSAIKEAVRLGVHMIEIDLHLTADNQVILMHDTSVNRTTNGNGVVRQMTLEQIRQLRFRGLPTESVPTFEEALLATPKNMWLALDMKARGPEGLALGDATLKVLQKHQRTRQVILGCGPTVGAVMRNKAPEMLYLHVDDQFGDSYIERCLETKSKFVMLRSERPPIPELMAQLKQHGLKSFYYYTSTEADFRRIMEAGVNYPFADNLPAALKACEAMGIEPLKPEW